jgi:hypothetical protein
MPLKPLTDIPTIRILVYTDDARVQKNDDDFGISFMEKFLLAHQPRFGKPEIELVNRDADSRPTAKNKLMGLLQIGNYDQVWFFGIHLSNLTEPVPSAAKKSKELCGGPESELTDDEVVALRKWMETGGVLVTGDHSEGKSDKAVEPSLSHIVSLGRALGSRVPRAGQLRTWEGGPTTDLKGSFNTQELKSSTKLNDPSLEADENPQKIVLPRYNGSGELDPNGDFHNLFKDKKGLEIDVFPDHMHEGEILIPSQLNGDWPLQEPRPLVIAKGVDKRNANVYNLVIAYAGLNARSGLTTGRIVVDSTWHHYLNKNLKGFEDTGEGSIVDRIGQYYGNLAVWLSPLAKRKEMSEAMFRRVVQRLREVPDLIDDDPGKVARKLLAEETSACEINELLLAFTPASLQPLFEMAHFPENGSTLGPLPSQELILGTVIRESGALTAAGEGVLKSAVIDAGFAKAFSLHAEKLKQAGEALNENSA